MQRRAPTSPGLVTIAHDDHHRQSMWHLASMTPRTLAWSAILATVTLLGLLLTFQQVVGAAVRQGGA